ncbi:MAG: stage III sporulation protein AE [Clostridium sp.]|nr:stage III sporulation protein AE [Clostridium sp.]
MVSGSKTGIFFMVLLWLLLGAELPAQAGAYGEVPETETGMQAQLEDDLLEEFDLEPLEEFLTQGNEEGFSVSFRELLELLKKGEVNGAVRRILDGVKENLFGEVRENGRWMGQILILGLLGAVFANYASIFTGSQIAEMGFYVTYLFIFTFLASSFLTGLTVTKELLGQVLEFMRALVPAFFLSVSFAGGSVTSSAGCSLMLISIRLVEWLFLTLFLPLIQMYILLVLAGHLIKEDLFSRTTELLEQGLRWGVKTMTGAVLGFHLLQGMVVPYADAVKNAPLRRLVGAIPSVGNGAAAVSQMLLGAGALMKNSIGAGAALVLLGLSAIPLLKLLILGLFYQGTAALLQPVCDKRLISCISGVGTGSRLLLLAASSSVLLFLLSIAIVCLGSNTMYLAG